MKNFVLGGITVILISYLGCYMYELGKAEQSLKMMGVPR